MWLYNLHEWQKATLNATEPLTNASDMWLNFGVQTQMHQILRATNELVKRASLEEIKPSFNIHEVAINYKNIESLKVKIAEDVIVSNPFCDLLHFKKILLDNDEKNLACKNNYENFLKQMPKLLIVAPLSGHYATLLRDTVSTCLKDFDVYITDWQDSRMVPLDIGDFDLNDYVDYLIEFFSTLGENLNVFAVCQPTVPVLMASAHMHAKNLPCPPKSIILMAGPIDARINPGELNDFAFAHNIEWFENNFISTVPSYYPGAGRKVCPGFVLLSAFMMLNPKRHQEAGNKLFHNLLAGNTQSVDKHKAFYDEYRAVMDVPATYYLNSIDYVFKRFSLPKGIMPYRDTFTNLKDIKDTFLLTIEGELDDISPLGQTAAALDLCENIPTHYKKTYIQKGSGHYGVFSGSKWREQIYPKIVNFCQNNEI